PAAVSPAGSGNGGLLASSQSRTSARNSSSAGDHPMSIGAPSPKSCIQDTHRGSVRPMPVTKPAVPAVAGWFTTDDEPVLLGSRCDTCGVVSFPPRSSGCPDPRCRGTELSTHALARTGRVWSFTDAQYQPPPPYVSPSDPYR